MNLFFLSSADVQQAFAAGAHNLHAAVSDFIAGPIMCAVFVLIGIYLTFRTRWFQITRLGLWWKTTIGAVLKDKTVVKTSDKQAISQFQALSTALAATTGTGNIAGVATAIVLGGPGAVFWMWVSAFFGMMTKFSEIVLSMKYRYKNKKGEWVGGPMVFLDRGLNMKWLAVLFAIFATLASFGIGCSTQSNSAAEALYTVFGADKGTIGAILAILCGMVIIGGIKRIGKVTEILVPFMAILYILGSLVLIFMNIGQFVPACKSIFSGAFQLKSVGGGIGGFTISQAMRFGVARGVFSNEAGLGSSSMVHAASDTKEPVQQAMWGIFEVFADTIVGCTITALSILVTNVHQFSNNTGAALTSEAFTTSFGSFGGVFVAVGITLFAFSTLVSWSYYGERGCEYLFGSKSIILYKLVYIFCIYLGAKTSLDLIWNIADTLNGLMAIPNLIGVVAMSGTVAIMTKEYLAKQIKYKNRSAYLKRHSF
ncbi:MAG: alanine/glycine:cation symporter family protein [Oscillospiraceae bacterium]|nr:alanine/glycine:cation symporter family protein [Oscillospiraceae bacterium]